MRRLIRFAAVVLGALAVLAAYVLYPPPARHIEFPGGKRFAFTIVDDADMATLERNRPVYEVLHRYGLRTTKTVWVLESTETSHAPNRGDSLRDPAYRDFIRELHRQGFEIALHGVRGGSSRREDIITGLREFQQVIGTYPRLHVNHSLNRDNLYWGAQRWLLQPLQWAYALRSSQRFSGEDPESPYFWGDLAQQHIQYVNQFTFRDPNLLRVTPSFPYHLADRLYVNFWFPTADGNNLDAFEKLLSKDNLDRLEREGGICLVYTHLGSGSFNTPAGVNPRFEDRIRDVASRNGWFVPASELLDHLQRQPGWRADPGWRESARLELLFLWDLVVG